jgi:hypothetical protein
VHRREAGLAGQDLVATRGHVVEHQIVAADDPHRRAVERNRRSRHVALHPHHAHALTGQGGEPLLHRAAHRAAVGLRARDLLGDPGVDLLAAGVEQLQRDHEAVARGLLHAAEDQLAGVEVLRCLRHAGGRLVGTGEDELHLDEILAGHQPEGLLGRHPLPKRVRQGRRHRLWRPVRGLDAEHGDRVVGSGGGPAQEEEHHHSREDRGE